MVSRKSQGLPLRILMIAPTSFFSDYGGHIRILEETRALQELGHQVTIVTYYKGSDMPGLDIRRTAALPWHTDYEVGSSRHKLAFDIYLAASSLREGLRLRPQIVHGHMHEGALIGGFVARLLGIPLVFDYQGSMTSEMVDHDFLDPEGVIYPIAHRMERFINRRLPDAILTSSVQAREQLNQKFQVNPAIIHPLPDCADTEKFRMDLLSAEEISRLRLLLGIPPDRIIIAYLGLLTDYQGIPYLIEAASILKVSCEKIHFLVMGYPNVNHYRTLASQAGVSDYITFTGKVEYRDAPRYLSLGQIAVAPKISATEGSGKLLNYMALGQPVVAFDTPVHREYLGELGLYVPPGNAVELSNMIRLLVRDQPRRKMIGKQLRERVVEQYSWQRAGAAIDRVYQQLTSG
ncbi:MAG: glycosyltransferase family 4 protein [Candidatus Promineifilaceae bacterium]|nr:glycosyltransferase family 4 protein [Candidatus Promineifilaceae bacterium]